MLYVKTPCAESALVSYFRSAYGDGSVVKLLDSIIEMEIDDPHEQIDDEISLLDSDRMIMHSFISKPNETEDEFDQRYVQTMIEAARHGNTIAEFACGQFYDDGIYFEQDKKSAYEYFRKSGKSEFPPALSLLGIMAIYGVGAEVDTEFGARCLNKAFDHGDQVAIDFLEERPEFK